MINRRRFLQAGAAATAALAWPFRAFPFAQSPIGIKKYAVSLPGLGPSGIPELTKTQQTINGVVTDVYEAVATPFTQNLLGAASTLNHATKLWGYADAANPASARYLGGVIVATRGIPVQLRVKNSLPALHILPNDISLIDPASGEASTAGRGDRIAVHLHGGLIFWDSDGNPFLWYSNADPANGGFVHGSSFINGDPANPGTAIYNYPNEQSARMMWYHDHAYGLTRTNVYAGLVTAYLVTDDQETQLVNSGAIPHPSLGGVAYPLGIPLIIQDKTFWDGPGGSDPNYPSAVPAGTQIAEGDLWFPHVYEGDLDTNIPDMGIPPTSTSTARWGATAVPPATVVTPDQFPTPSSVPEYFSDTILVNGAPYPTVTVPPQRFRFRILNGANSRFFNLQLYVADATVDGITTGDTGEVDPNANETVVPINRSGPAFIQIGNEGGFLPAPVVFSTAANGLTNLNSNRTMGFKLNSDILASHRRADSGPEVPVAGELIRVAEPGDPTIGGANRFNLLLAPAERADIIIDFRGFEGKKLILYNDAPAPFPGGDIRNDYYVGAPNLTAIGGVAGTQPGQGPDTRILMRFEVSSSGGITEPSFSQTVTMLQTQLPAAFAASQPSLNLTPTVTKIKSLLEDNDEFGRLRQLLSDESATAITFLDTPTDTVTVGDVQEWDIYNLTADTHPIHFHLVNVKVVGRQPWAFDSTTGGPILPLQPLAGSTMVGPDPNEMGWKETVRMNPGEITRVQMKFDLPTPIGAVQPPANSPRLLAMYNINGAEYVWHCHILEHEEHDMMHPLVVMAAAKK